MLQVPKPILFHSLKHHLQYIRYFIKTAGIGNITEIKNTLQTIGTSQLDLYTGELTPLQIAQETIFYLEQHDSLSPEGYSAYLANAGASYRVIKLSDNTDWILRWGVQIDSYVHLHPARYTCNTKRVKATALKTAIATTVYSHHTESEINLSLINQIRTEWLGLSQIKALSINEGLSIIINLLKDDQ